MNEPVNPAANMGNASNASFEPYTAFSGVEQTLEQHLGATSKLQLPENMRAGFVRFLPWVALLFLPLHFAAVLLLLGISALATLVGSPSIIGALVSVGVLVLDVIALPGLFARKRQGWAFFTYAIAAGAVGDLLSFSIFGLVMSAALLWLSFQVKYHYR